MSFGLLSAGRWLYNATAGRGLKNATKETRSIILQAKEGNLSGDAGGLKTYIVLFVLLTEHLPADDAIHYSRPRFSGRVLETYGTKPLAEVERVFGGEELRARNHKPCSLGCTPCF